MRALPKLLTIVIFTVGFIACSDNQPKQAVIHDAVAMESSDQCHLCGMLITHFDGPKGEIFPHQSPKVFKFCSTRDMFSYYFKPENKNNVSQMLVHDMSKMPWGSDGIDDKHLIDATKAWFVVGSEKMGSMGKTLASFSVQKDANEFASKFGGTVFAFAALNQENY